MPLKYPVKPKTILLCDYDQVGFRPPEMIKRRPVVVLVGSLSGRAGLHTVIPLSGTPSNAKQHYHCKIELAQALPAPFDETTWWVKADMIATLSMNRLDLFRTGRDQYGQRKYLPDLKVSDDQFATIQAAVARALELPS